MFEKGQFKRAYISGPMTGYPEFNRPMFMRAGSDLEKLGWFREVINPASMDEGEKPWSYYLSRDLKVIMTDGGVTDMILLPDWEKSKGARLEVKVATALYEPRLWLWNLTYDLTPMSIEVALDMARAAEAPEEREVESAAPTESPRAFMVLRPMGAPEMVVRTDWIFQLVEPVEGQPAKALLRDPAIQNPRTTIMTLTMNEYDRLKLELSGSVTDRRAAGDPPSRWAPRSPDPVVDAECVGETGAWGAERSGREWK